MTSETNKHEMWTSVSECGMMRYIYVGDWAYIYSFGSREAVLSIIGSTTIRASQLAIVADVAKHFDRYYSALTQEGDAAALSPSELRHQE